MVNFFCLVWQEQREPGGKEKRKVSWKSLDSCETVQFGTTHFRKFWNKIRMIDETRTSALLCFFLFKRSYSYTQNLLIGVNVVSTISAVCGSNFERRSRNIPPARAFFLNNNIMTFLIPWNSMTVCADTKQSSDYDLIWSKSEHPYRQCIHIFSATSFWKNLLNEWNKFCSRVRKEYLCVIVFSSPRCEKKWYYPLKGFEKKWCKCLFSFCCS